MTIKGRYVDKGRLQAWGADPGDGDAPAVHVELEFPAILGPVQRLTMWALVDTGADGIAVPCLPMGVVPQPNGVPKLLPGSYAWWLPLVPRLVTGIGGASVGFAIQANVRVDSHPIAGPQTVVICNHIKHALIGRSIINRYIGVFHRPRRKLCFTTSVCVAAGTTLRPTLGRRR